MERNCSALSAAQFDMAFVDMGVADKDVHTTFSQLPAVALNAFVDYLFLMDATYIVSSGSSFSGTVCSIKGLRSQENTSANLTGRRILMCMPPICDMM